LEVLYDLAAEGPGEGAIVNLGQFRGGSSIIMAKASKLKGRDKLHSFDPLYFPWTEDIFKKNDVADWIIYAQTTSQDGVKEWAKREDPRIRLLFVDGDHSYEGCRRDIVDWAPFIVPGGLLCVHDYCNNGIQWSSLTEVVKGVHDAMEQSGEFFDFRRKETLFIANKKK
jgi:predicted O-methyltransferase YrrM